MRILHVTPTYLPAVRYGGPIYSVHGLATAQAARGDEAHVITTNVDGPRDLDVPIGEPVEIDGVKVSYFPCGFGRRLYRSPSMARAAAQIIANVDVAHIHSAFLWPPTAIATMMRRHGVPYIFSPRGMLSARLIHAKGRVRKSLWINLFGRKLIESAAAVHVTSDVERADLDELQVKPKRIFLAPNGVDPPPLPEGVARAEMARVLSLGRISWKKGLDRLILAFARTKAAELVIAGNDEEGLTPKLRQVAGDAGCVDRVRFLGPVDGEEKWRLLHSANVFALASHSENFGNSVLEAMACGVPVVVTPQVGLAPSIARVGAGIVAPGDPDAFGAALTALLDDPMRRAACGAAGRETAEREFSWHGIAEEMNELYKSAIGR